MGDIKTVGTYGATYLADDTALSKKVESSGVGFRLSRSLHCTLIYSESYVEVEPQKGSQYPTKILDLDWWEGHDKMGYVVALLEPTSFLPRHQDLLARGGQCAYHEYRPHMTLTWGVHTEFGRVPMTPEQGRAWVAHLKPYLVDLPLMFIGERFSAIRF